MFLYNKSNKSQKKCSKDDRREKSAVTESIDVLLALEALEVKKEATFGQRLKEALGERTISGFAEEMNLSKQIISAYIHEKRRPKDATLYVMAETLGVNVGWLKGYNVLKEPGEADKFVKVSDIPSYVSGMLESEEEVVSFLSAMFSEKEIELIITYGNLPKEGRLYVEQTMEFVKSYYKR